MAENTKIEWATHTFNPWEGCTKVSPGCANCYAENRNKRWNKGEAINWGKGAPRRRTSKANWQKPLKWNRDAHLAYESGSDVRPRVFCASLADWLDDEVPVDWQNDLLRLIAATPYLDWLLLTKRPENWGGVLTNAVLDGIHIAHEWVHGRPPRNVWIGTSVEDQERANERVHKMMMEIPAKVRFLSVEPLLGPIDLTNIPDGNNGYGYSCLTGEYTYGWDEDCEPPSPWDYSIDWVIVGGESGPGARLMEKDWVRSLRDQCAGNTAFLFKQWGGVNKKATGRELDGRTWDEFPTI